MAQRRSYTYKEPINSFEFAQRSLPELVAGRYCGFDDFNIVAGLDLEIVHNLTGVYPTTKLLAIEGPFGGLITKQGIRVTETAPVPLTIATNAANASDRHDLIIFEHEHTEVIGGADGSYSVIQGPNGNPSPPALTNPEKQIILGTLVIPANEADLTNAVYTPAQVPLPGGQNIITNFPELDARFAKLAAYNAYTATQGFPAATGAVIGDLFGTLVGQKWTPVGDANFFIYPAGTAADIIQEIQATQDNAELIIYNGSANTLTIELGQAPAAGGLAIICPYRTTDIVLTQGQWVELRQIGGLTYVVVNDSVSLKDGTENANSSWTTLALLADQNLDDAGDYKWSTTGPNAPGVITFTTMTIKYKKIGKTLYLYYNVNVSFDVLNTDWTIEIKLPWVFTNAEYKQRYITAADSDYMLVYMNAGSDILTVRHVSSVAMGSVAERSHVVVEVN